MKTIIRATLAAALLAGTAVAQDMPRAPDGSRAFGFEPYFGVLGGFHSFDRRGAIFSQTNGRFNGELIEGVAGFNIPLGPLFAGAEGQLAKGFRDIDWEYGVRGRFGLRAGESGLLYASAGYTWIDPRGGRGFDRRHDWMWGIGVEVGPRQIGLGGLTGQSGARLRLQVETQDFDSIRPMAGIVFHF